jgi:hypothetical protein
MNRLLQRIAGFLILFLLSSTDLLAQCAMCRGSVASSIGNGKNTVAFGLNTGIVYLFLVPYIVVAVIIYLWFKNSKKERERKEMLAQAIDRAYSSR